MLLVPRFTNYILYEHILLVFEGWTGEASFIWNWLSLNNKYIISRLILTYDLTSIIFINQLRSNFAVFQNKNEEHGNLESCRRWNKVENCWIYFFIFFFPKTLYTISTFSALLKNGNTIFIRFSSSSNLHQIIFTSISLWQFPLKISPYSICISFMQIVSKVI